VADFCTNCAWEMFGPGVKPDIDVMAIFKKLKKDHYSSELCEGCGLIAIGNMDGKLVVRYINGNEWHEYKIEKHRRKQKAG